MNNNIIIFNFDNFTTSERAFLDFLLMQIPEPAAHKDFSFSFTFKEIKQYRTTIPFGRIHTVLRKANLISVISSLRDKKLRIYSPSSSITSIYTDVLSASYDEDTITITLNDFFKEEITREPYILNTLRVSLNLGNKYAAALYQYLRANSFEHSIDITDICSLLSIESNSIYLESFGSFRKAVLIPALTEINSTSMYNFSFFAVKSKKKVDSLHFYAC